MIFKYLQEKWQRFRDYRVHCAAGNEENCWLLFKLKKLAISLLQFYDAGKPVQKHLLKLTDYSKLSSFTNMVTKINVDDLKI